MVRKCVAAVRSTFLAGAALAALGAVCLTPLTAGAGGPAGEKAARGRATVRLLAEPISMKDFQVPMKLKEALHLFYEKLLAQGNDVSILVNTDAFKQADPNAPDLYEVDVNFPPCPRKVPLGTALRILLAQVPGQQATFLVKPGHIEITTLEEASPTRRLMKQKVIGSFEKQALSEVLQELAASEGVTILIDPRAGERVKIPVSVTFVTETPLGSAMRLLTDMAGLRAVETEGGVYITTPENAAALRREQAARAAEGRKAACERKGDTAPASPGK
jgi:hypothetical protein